MSTAITLWSDAGLSNRHIMTLLGRRNENSLKSYNSPPSSQQLQLCSNVLSCALNPQAAQADQQMQVFPGNQRQPQQSRSAACAMIPNQQNFKRHEGRFNFSITFSDCQIGQVHVTFKSDQAKLTRTQFPFICRINSEKYFIKAIENVFPYLHSLF